jgi:DnaJ family protein B protein 12
MSTTSAERSSTTSTHRTHNQGRQDRNYTPAQEAAVNRVRRCKHTDYYAILDIEAPSSDGEIRKAYRKLALIMHPDKNGAPGADEAFKCMLMFGVTMPYCYMVVYGDVGMDAEN